MGFLVADVGRLMRRAFEARGGHLGLTQAQWRALSRLSRQEGINQTTLADLLEIQPITLTRLLDRMEAHGWIERRPDPSDRRAVRLHLTPRAQPLLAELQEVGNEIVDIALRGIEPAERRALVEALERMKTNLAEPVEPGEALRTGTNG
jgi:DNA-binding MarR family transcriptional regulator